MSLGYNIPAWSKHIIDNNMLDLLPPDPAHPTAAAPPDLYVARRMSDDVLSAESTATTTSGPASPATEPDIAAPAPPALRKPSLPGIGALTPLLDPTDPFPRRASLPTLTSDLSVTRSPAPRTAPFRSPQAPHRPFDPALASYSFPSPSDNNPAPERPRLDPSSFAYPSPAQPSATSSSFPSPFASPLSPASFAQYQHQQQWSPDTPASTSAPTSPRTKRRSSPPTPQSTTATTAAVTAPAPSAAPDAPPQRRRGKLPKHTTDLLKEWLHAHSDHPYPSEDEKRDLCARTKLSMSQVSNWMINARRRILAPAKHPTQAATTTEPYRPLGARPIGALYHSPHTQPYPRYRDDALRLYDPAGFPATFPPASYPQYPDRRLAYPASTLDPTFPHPQGYAPGIYPAPARDPGAPRFYAAAPDMQ